MNLSAVDVRQRVNNKTIILSDLPSRRLSKNQAIIEILNKKKIDVITIPNGLENDALMHSLLNVFTTNWYAIDLGLNAKHHVNSTVKSYFLYIEQGREEHETIEKENAFNCRFKKWFEYLRENNSSYDVWKKMSEMLKILTRSLEQEFGEIKRWPTNLRAEWKILKQHTPIKPKHIKCPPLGRYLGIPPEQFTNKELLMGLRYGAIWMLQKLFEQREVFLSNKVIDEAVNKLYGKDISCIKKFFIRPRKTLSFSNEVKPIASASLRIIKQYPLLTEWQFYCFSKIRGSLTNNEINNGKPFESSTQNMLISRCINNDGTIRERVLGYGQSDQEWSSLEKLMGSSASKVCVPLPCIWGQAWILHTPLERLLMVWLLATERAQQSGIEKLTFSGVHYSDNGRALQISTLKLRRSKGASGRTENVETMIYRRREAPFIVYNKWFEQLKTQRELVKNYNPTCRFIPYSSAAVSGVMAQKSARILPNSMLPLELLAVENTVWQKTFLEDTSKAGQREAQAFIAILKNRIILKKLNPDLNLRIPISPIGQSLVVERERRTDFQNEVDLTESNSLGHSFVTGKNIYKDGFRDLSISEIIEPIQAFARKVGDDKIRLATEMAEKLAEATRNITWAEIQKLSGIDSAISDQNYLLSVLDEKDMLTISGEIKFGSEVLIIHTEMVAGLMAGYIQHIETALPKLIETIRSEISIRFLTKLIYLHQIFKKFPKYLQISGRKLAVELNFNFPPIC